MTTHFFLLSGPVTSERLSWFEESLKFYFVQLYPETLIHRGKTDSPIFTFLLTGDALASLEGPETQEIWSVILSLTSVRIICDRQELDLRGISIERLRMKYPDQLIDLNGISANSQPSFWNDVAALVRQDQIDILVDLTMHMGGSRLLMFARKPAPVQVTYLAYCGTTGMAAMDYRITDPFLDPPEENGAAYSERSVWIPSYWCYGIPEEAPPVNDLPALSGGHITFTCLNNFSKVSPESLEIWARVLTRVPNARLLLHAHPGSCRQRVGDALARHGVDPARCTFTANVSVADYFRLYHQADIALDCFPYAGGTTTCDALWMGVPLVTLARRTAVGRGGLSRPLGE